MQPNALRYVLCAINKAKNGKRIFLDLPRQFVMAVEVYQVVVFLQVEDCIGPLHGHIRQVIRERPLEPIELEAVRFCLSNLAPKIYEFALSTQYERERQVWLLGPRIQDPEHKDQAMRIVDEEAESSGEETVIEMDSHQDTEMISHDIGTASDEIGYTAEDEASNQEYETTDQEYERPTTCIPIRRRSAPTPYSTRMYDIDTSEFRECADEDPEYRSTGGRREEHCLHTDKDKQTQTILNNARSQINYASPIGIYHNGGTLLEEEWVGFCNRRSLKVEDMSLRRRIVADVVERWLWRSDPTSSTSSFLPHSDIKPPGSQYTTLSPTIVATSLLPSSSFVCCRRVHSVDSPPTPSPAFGLHPPEKSLCRRSFAVSTHNAKPNQQHNTRVGARKRKDTVLCFCQTHVFPSLYSQSIHERQKSSKPTTTLLTILPLTKPTPSTSKKGSRRESNPGPLAIGLEFSRCADANLPKRVSYR
ncbi:hypothetical protein KCU72_g15, partial [Aureobasidium melanogenum]